MFNLRWYHWLLVIAMGANAFLNTLPGLASTPGVVGAAIGSFGGAILLVAFLRWVWNGGLAASDTDEVAAS